MVMRAVSPCPTWGGEIARLREADEAVGGESLDVGAGAARVGAGVGMKGVGVGEGVSVGMGVAIRTLRTAVAGDDVVPASPLSQATENRSKTSHKRAIRAFME